MTYAQRMVATAASQVDCSTQDIPFFAVLDSQGANLAVNIAQDQVQC